MLLSQVDLLIAGKGDRLVAEIIRQLRCQRCRGAPDRVELVTCLPAHRYPIRRIALRSLIAIETKNAQASEA